MKKNVLVIASMLSVALLASSNSFAQSASPSAGDYVRNTTTVPDVTSAGWTHDVTRDRPLVSGTLVKEVHVGTSQGLVVLQVARVSPREVLWMEFGKMSTVRTEVVVRAAIKVDGTWYVARGLFMDEGVVNPENYFKTEGIKDSQGNDTAVKVSLETLDGLKSIVVNLQ